MAKTRLDGLQVMRAVAASLVLVQHAYFYAGRTVGMDVTEFLRLSLGTIGVFLFFSISGAVMALGTSNDQAGTFAIARLVRIYPPYIAALGLSAVFLTVGGAAPTWAWDLSVLLLPTGNLNSSFFVPYWTLIYEMFFYALLWIVSLLGVPHRARAWLAVAWVGLIVAAAGAKVSVPTANPDLVHILVSPINVYLAIGYAIGSAIVLRDAKPLGAMAFLLAAGHYAGLTTAPNLMFVLLSAGAIYLAIAFDRFNWPSPIVRIGDLSYGLYLMHLPFVFGVHLWATARHWSFIEALAAMLVIGGAAGLVYGYLEHRAYVTFLRPWTRKLRARLAASTQNVDPKALTGDIASISGAAVPGDQSDGR